MHTHTLHVYTHEYTHTQKSLENKKHIKLELEKQGSQWLKATDKV